MDTTKPVTHVSLCAGYGGIDLGLKRAIPNLRTVAFSEIEAFACANLVAKMEAGCLDPAPIWTDLKTFPWAEFRGKVDILSGGYPCQPFSSAGKRLGKEDPRHLWPWIADGIRVLQPTLCFFENVEGHISLGLRDVIGELEESGYRATWGVFSAAEVGAPHQRKREMGWPSPSSRDHKGAPASRCTPEGYNARLDEAVILHGPADPASPNLPGSHPESLATENASFNPLAGNWQTATVSTGAHRQKNGSMIPKLDTQVGGKLNPRWVETLMGLPVGWTMPSCACPVTIAPTSCDS